LDSGSEASQRFFFEPLADVRLHAFRLQGGQQRQTFLCSDAALLDLAGSPLGLG